MELIKFANCLERTRKLTGYISNQVKDRGDDSLNGLFKKPNPFDEIICCLEESEEILNRKFSDTIIRLKHMQGYLHDSIDSGKMLSAGEMIRARAKSGETYDLLSLLEESFKVLFETVNVLQEKEDEIKPRELKTKRVYRHYKGQYYYVNKIVIHTETNERMVDYQALYGKHEDFVRPLDMFLEEAPQNEDNIHNQAYRFEEVSDFF